MTTDQKLHAAMGLLIAGVCTFLAAMLAQALQPVLPAVLHPLAEPVPAALLGLLAGERAGWVKEYVWDAGGRGTVDRADYLYTVCGAIAGAVLGAALVAVVQALAGGTL